MNKEMPTSKQKVLLDALKYLQRHYVGVLEHGRDRILSLGGQCDPVDVMERNDPHLRQVREVISSVEATPDETSDIQLREAKEIIRILLRGEKVNVDRMEALLDPGSPEEPVGDRNLYVTGGWDGRLIQQREVELPPHVYTNEAGCSSEKARADNTCRQCCGSGTIEVPDEAGPNAYPMDVNCPTCKGTGVEAPVNGSSGQETSTYRCTGCVEGWPLGPDNWHTVPEGKSYHRFACITQNGSGDV